jgi:hypothetical protein
MIKAHDLKDNNFPLIITKALKGKNTYAFPYLDNNT